MTAWLIAHVRAALHALGALARAPLSTAFTVAALGVSAALPLGLYTTVDNIGRWAGSVDTTPRLTVFFAPPLDDARGRALTDKLAALPGVDAAHYHSHAQALDEFRRLSGLGAGLEGADPSALPAYALVEARSAGAVSDLAAEIGRVAGVDRVHVDLEWLAQLRALAAATERAVWTLSLILAVGAALIVGNTMKLVLAREVNDIEVLKLVGATDAFIRRPYLYSGAIQGLLGALLGLVVVWGAAWALAGPLGHFAATLGASWDVRGPGLATAGLVLFGGIGLGLLGTGAIVSMYLRTVLSPR